MARVTYSPLVVEMSGKVGDAVFSRWKGIDYVRSRVTPANPQTTAQTTQREALANTLDMWQSVKSWAQAVWNTFAEGYALSGYNRYMGENIEHTRDLEAGLLTPVNVDYNPISAHAAVAGASGCITCTWTDDDASADDKVRTFYRKTESAKEEYAWTYDAEVAASAATASISGLTPSEEYEIAFMARDSVTEDFAVSFNKILDCGS